MWLIALHAGSYRPNHHGHGLEFVPTAALTNLILAVCFAAFMKAMRQQYSHASTRSNSYTLALAMTGRLWHCMAHARHQYNHNYHQLQHQALLLPLSTMPVACLETNGSTAAATS
jgi:hypothetical protein